MEHVLKHLRTQHGVEACVIDRVRADVARVVEFGVSPRLLEQPGLGARVGGEILRPVVAMSE